MNTAGRGFAPSRTMETMMSTQTDDPRVRLDIYSHFVKVSNYDRFVLEQFFDYIRTHLTTFKQKWNGHKNVWEIDRMFVAATTDRRAIRFHRNELDQVYRVLERAGHGRSVLNVVEHELYEPVKAEFKRVDDRPPREEQVELIDYLIADAKEGYAPSKMVELQTGKGKTYLSLYGIWKMNLRTLLVVKPMYMSKWIEDVAGDKKKGTTGAFDMSKKGRLLVIQGSKDMINLIALAKAGELEAQFIIISINTMRDFIEETRGVEDDNNRFGIHPEKLCETLGIGIRLVDEAHQEYHAIYRMDLFTHTHKTISLSATMKSDDQFINDRYETQWPLPTRGPKVPFHRYIHVRTVWFSIDDAKGLRYKNFMKQYSHTMFEQSIMKDKRRLALYTDMIMDLQRKIFIETRKPGQKSIIFFATKEMCTYFQAQFQAAYPELKVNRYIGEDPYSKLLEADMAITTLKSAGTAVDIVNLSRVLCTVAVSSKQANEQAVGRLRELVNYPGDLPEFYFLAAHQIDKHRTYAYEKATKLDGKVLTYQDLNSSYRI